MRSNYWLWWGGPPGPLLEFGHFCENRWDRPSPFGGLSSVILAELYGFRSQTPLALDPRRFHDLCNLPIGRPQPETGRMRDHKRRWSVPPCPVRTEVSKLP